MRTTNEYCLNVIGTSEQIGKLLADFASAHNMLRVQTLADKEPVSQRMLMAASRLFEKFCPGLNEEIDEFAHSVGIPVTRVAFYAQSYLERGCSLLAVAPHRTTNHHLLVGRNYDFNDSMEEMCFVYTSSTGKYNHLGSSLNLFGRSDGMNEYGLTVCKASNGFPVGNFPGAQPAQVTGFSFWVVVRALLEQCKTAEECLAWLLEAPIAYNINLIAADPSGKTLLFETLDGHKSFLWLSDSPQGFISATNHSILDEIKPFEKQIMVNSEQRQALIDETCQTKQHISSDDIQQLLSTPFPHGVCCHYYHDFLGTLHSIIFDVSMETMKVAFGSPQVNQWHTYRVEPLQEETLTILLPDDSIPKDFYATRLGLGQ